MLLLWILFVICVYVCHAGLSVHCSLVATCWERANLLALLYAMFSWVLLLSHVVSLVRCGTWLYRFLIFAFFLTLLIWFALYVMKLNKLTGLSHEMRCPTICHFDKCRFRRACTLCWITHRIEIHGKCTHNISIWTKNHISSDFICLFDCSILKNEKYHIPTIKLKWPRPDKYRRVYAKGNIAR